MNEINVQNKKNEDGYGKKNDFLISLFIGTILIVFAIIIFMFPVKNKDIKHADFSGITEICELATLKCYYHNVAEYEKMPDGFFKYGLGQFGYKKMWLEYEGIIEVGIDVDEVQINEPDINGVVKIYLPEAKILKTNSDINSVGEPIVETGVLTSIEVEDEAKVFSLAQENMYEEVSEDKAIFKKARNNAKRLFERYVVKVGKLIGEEYTVEWVEEP